MRIRIKKQLNEQKTKTTADAAAEVQHHYKLYEKAAADLREIIQLRKDLKDAIGKVRVLPRTSKYWPALWKRYKEFTKSAEVDKIYDEFDKFHAKAEEFADKLDTEGYLKMLKQDRLKKKDSIFLRVGDAAELSMRAGIQYIIRQGKQGIIPDGADPDYYLETADKIVKKYQTAIKHQFEMLKLSRQILAAMQDIDKSQQKYDKAEKSFPKSNFGCDIYK